MCVSCWIRRFSCLWREGRNGCGGRGVFVGKPGISSQEVLGWFFLGQREYFTNKNNKAKSFLHSFLAFCYISMHISRVPDSSLDTQWKTLFRHSSDSEHQLHQWPSRPNSVSPLHACATVKCKHCKSATDVYIAPAQKCTSSQQV